MADMIVANAEYSAANGTYTESGTEPGKPLYIHESNSNYLISWDGEMAWILFDSVDYIFFYGCEEDVATPDLCSDWYDGLTQEPSALTVTAAGGSAQNLTLSCAAGSYSLTGTDATLTYTPAAQNLTLSCNAGSLALTGSAATMTVQRNYTLACEAGSYTITGTAATFEVKRNFTLSCNAGSYSLTGTNADLTVTRHYTLSCEGGSYSLTGTNASLTSSRTLICEPASGGAYPDIIVSGAGTTDANGTYVYLGELFGKPLYTNGDNSILWYDNKWTIVNAFEMGNRYESTDDVATPDLVTTWTVGGDGTLPVPTVAAGTSLGYILTGSDVTLTYTQGAQNLTLACGAGSYSLTGTDISFGNTKSYELVCDAGSYALTGSDVSFVIARNYSLSMGAGSYSLTGTDCTLSVIHTYSLSCNSGSYLLTGKPASITSARTLGCVPGSYTLTGLEADLFKALVMPCGNGSYVLTGSPATINSARTFALGMGSYVLVGTDAGLFILTTTPDCRTYFIDAENRTWLIDSEDRTRVIDAENRTLEVRCH